MQQLIERLRKPGRNRQPNNGFIEMPAINTADKKIVLRDSGHAINDHGRPAATK